MDLPKMLLLLLKKVLVFVHTFIVSAFPSLALAMCLRIFLCVCMLRVCFMCKWEHVPTEASTYRMSCSACEAMMRIWNYINHTEHLHRFITDSDGDKVEERSKHGLTGVFCWDTGWNTNSLHGTVTTTISKLCDFLFKFLSTHYTIPVVWERLWSASK